MEDKITILGAGHQGMTMAAHLSANGVKCNLWNRSENHIKEILETKIINCTGILEGTFNIYQVSTDIDKVLSKTIMITTPSSAHRDLAKLLSSKVDDTYTIILNPGRTFGMLDFLYTLKKCGCKKMPCIAEAQTIIYTCRRDLHNSICLYALKEGVPISTMRNEDIKRVMKVIPECMRNHFTPAKSFFETSMNNVGMVLHCAPVLMNIGWIENQDVQFEYYYDGISKSIARVLEKLDNERLAVADAFSYPVESIVEWLHRTYQTEGKNLYEHLQNNNYYRGIDAPKNIHHRYIEEDVPNGLVPLEDAGAMYGIPTPVASSVISLANIVMDCDYRKLGRRYSVLKEIEDDFIEEDSYESSKK